MKKILSVVLALTMVFSLTAISASADGAQEITYSLYSQPDGIDPGITNNSFASDILANAFEKTAATTVVIPQGCKTIGARAFANSGVRTVKIPASVTTIADDAFYSCGKIIMVTTNETAIEYAREHNMMVGAP